MKGPCSLFSPSTPNSFPSLPYTPHLPCSNGSVAGEAKSLESDVKLEHILSNKKAAEVSKIYLGRHVYMYLLIYRPDLFDYAELFAHLDECVDCAVEVFTIVTC